MSCSSRLIIGKEQVSNAWEIGWVPDVLSTVLKRKKIFTPPGLEL
jgi:hypothetical protein